MMDWTKATSKELLAWKTQHSKELAEADPAIKDQLDGLIMQATIREEIAAARKQDKILERGKEWDVQAEKDWPELKDKESELYKKTIQAMEEDPTTSMEDPYALYNHATRIGISMGLLPAGAQPRRGTEDPMDTIGGGEGAPAGNEKPSEGEEFLKKTAGIAEAYGDIIDMNNKEVRERIAQSAEEGVDNG